MLHPHLIFKSIGTVEQHKKKYHETIKRIKYTVPLNLTKEYAKICCQIRRGVEFSKSRRIRQKIWSN